MSQREDRIVTLELNSTVFTNVRYDVSCRYSVSGDDEVSIEDYEVDGDTVAREELVAMFGEEAIKQMETDLE